MKQGFRMALGRGQRLLYIGRGGVGVKELRWSRGHGIVMSSIHVNSLDHRWINRPKTALKSMVQIVGRSTKWRRVSGLHGRLVGLWAGPASPLLWPFGPSFGVVSSRTFQSCLHSFHGLNHLLSSVCLFGVYDSGPRGCFLDKSSCSHEITKACGIHQFKPLYLFW